MDPLRVFPFEVLSAIIARLPARQIIVCTRINKGWRAAIHNLCTLDWAKKTLPLGEDGWYDGSFGAPRQSSTLEKSWIGFYNAVKRVHNLHTGQVQRSIFIGGESKVPSDVRITLTPDFIIALKRSGSYEVALRTLHGVGRSCIITENHIIPYPARQVPGGYEVCLYKNEFGEGDLFNLVAVAGSKIVFNLKTMIRRYPIMGTREWLVCYDVFPGRILWFRELIPQSSLTAVYEASPAGTAWKIYETDEAITLNEKYYYNGSSLGSSGGNKFMYFYRRGLSGNAYEFHAVVCDLETGKPLHQQPVELLTPEIFGRPLHPRKEHILDVKGQWTARLVRTQGNTSAPVAVEFRCSMTGKILLQHPLRDISRGHSPARKFSAIEMRVVSQWDNHCLIVVQMLYYTPLRGDPYLETVWTLQVSTTQRKPSNINNNSHLSVQTSVAARILHQHDYCRMGCRSHEHEDKSALLPEFGRLVTQLRMTDPRYYTLIVRFEEAKENKRWEVIPETGEEMEYRYFFIGDNYFSQAGRISPHLPDSDWPMQRLNESIGTDLCMETSVLMF